MADDTTQKTHIRVRLNARDISFFENNCTTYYNFIYYCRMLVLNDEHIERLEKLFEQIERFEDNYNRDPNHYPSTIWQEIAKFKHDVNEYNDKGFFLSNLK